MMNHGPVCDGIMHRHGLQKNGRNVFRSEDTERIRAACFQSPEPFPMAGLFTEAASAWDNRF